MSFQVTIQPSGHTFTALPEETLLEAALRSGINITYNCSSGTCGDCRVRLLEGEVEASMPAGYRFTQQQLNENFILMCTNRAASDLVIEAQEALSPSDIPNQLLTAKVAKIEAPSDEVRILHLRTPRTKTLRFMAGQHVCLVLPEVGDFDAAVGSCPCNGMNLQFHLPWDEGDAFLRHLYNGMRVGEKIEVDGPYGDVTLDDYSERPLVLLAMGTDFAPIKSLIEHAINLDLRQPVRLLWVSPEAVGHYQENHCRAWGEVLDDYRYQLLTTAGREPSNAEFKELKALLGEMLNELEGADAYISGSRLFHEVCREHLQTLGVERERIFELHRRHSRREHVFTARPLSPVSNTAE